MSRRTTLLFGWLLALVVAAVFGRLGFWQLDRAGQKQAMLDDVTSTLEQRIPMPLSQVRDRAHADNYDWAAGAGRFVDAPAVLLDNQQRDGRVGVRAYRLFKPDTAAPLLVELGWLPLPGNRRMPAVPRPPGHVRVEGLLAPPPAQGIVDAPARRQANGSVLVIGMDTNMLARALQQPRLPPRVLKLAPDALPALVPDYRRDFDILPNTLPPQRHLGYAVQWFALALAVLATALILTLRKPRR